MKSIFDKVVKFFEILKEYKYTGIDFLFTTLKISNINKKDIFVPKLINLNDKRYQTEHIKCLKC